MAAQFARNAITNQMENMKNWSLIADYENPYITMDPTYEARETLVLGGLISKGCLYRQLMPVHWSPSSRTALAESELEYKDIESTAAYICMPIASADQSLGMTAQPLIKHPMTGKLVMNPSALSLVIWTTTPWTIPANRAICVAPEGVYSQVNVKVKTTTVIDGIVQEHVETRNCIVIGSMVENLCQTWENPQGLSVDHFRPKMTDNTDGNDGNTTPFTRLGVETSTIGEYNVDLYGDKAIIKKGKQSGSIQDTILSRSVDVSIIRNDILGKNLDSLEYVSPLSLDIPEYLSSDASRFIKIDATTGKAEGTITTDPGCELNEYGLYRGKGTDTNEQDKIYIPIHKVIPADHVLTDAGSGCVHTAPAHGDDDFQVGIQHNIPIACPVDDKGEYYSYMKELAGMEALGKGNTHVLDMVRNTGLLLHQEQYEHRYPHDWRTLKPIMFRATSQWFCKLDEGKEIAKQSLEDVYITTDSARSRLTAFIDSRDKWCISRQRSWGLPLPVFYSTDDDDDDHNVSNHDTSGEKKVVVKNTERDALYGLEITHNVSQIFSILGTQSWWQLPSWRLLPPKFRGEVNPKYHTISLDDIVDHYCKQNGLEYHNVDTDTLDSHMNRIDHTNPHHDHNNNNNNTDDNTNNPLQKIKTITHVNGEPVVGLPHDYYDCKWTIGTDTVDVWLDSGSSWYSALAAKIQAGEMKHKEIINNTTLTEQERVELLFKGINDDKPIADLYLEGTDQHRGWFQSSILLSSLLTKQSPFAALHSHGFVVDELGKKMSKSLGNGLEPDEIILEQGHGSDVLRVWAASVDASKDAVMSKAIMQTAIDFVRKWRGVMRFAIGSMTVNPVIEDKNAFIKSFEEQLTKIDGQSNSPTQQTDGQSQHKKGKKQKRSKQQQQQEDNHDDASKYDIDEPYEIAPWHFNPQTDLIPYKQLHILDKYLLHQLSLTLREVDHAFETYQVHKAIQSLRAFINGPLSAIFIDLSKDRLYAESSTSHHRASALTTLWYTFNSLLKVLTPITPHLTQEVFEYLPTNIRHALMMGLSPISNDSDSEVELPSGIPSKVKITHVDDHPMNDCVVAGGWTETKKNWYNDDIANQFETIIGVRAAANRCIEYFRQNASQGDSLLGKIGSSNEVDVTIILTRPYIDVRDDNNTDHVSLSQTQTVKEKTDNIDAIYKTLVTADNLHELLMVASVNVQIKQQTREEYLLEKQAEQASSSSSSSSASDNDSEQSTTTDSSTGGKPQESLVKITSSKDRHFVATTTHISFKRLASPPSSSSSHLDIPVDIFVSKSNGSKCPRCWRFSQTSTEMDQLTHDIGSATKITSFEKVWSTHIPKAITPHQDPEDPLCQRCDDVCCS